MIRLEKNVRKTVTELLAMLNPQIDEYSDTYRHVRDTLTRMAIVGTAPAGCVTSQATGQQENDDDDFSRQKEAYIAP